MARLLLVDDDDDLAFLTARLARDNGHTLVHAPTIARAWDSIRSDRPELVLLDVNLPGENGLTWCREVRACAETETLPIALFAQLDREVDLAASLEAGVDFWFDKKLICDPAAWQIRLQEILAEIDPDSAFMGYNETNDIAGMNWALAASTLTEMLRRPMSRSCGVEPTRVLTRWTAAQFARSASIAFPVPGNWLSSDGSVPAEALRKFPEVSPLAMRYFLRLAGNLHRFVGAEAGRPLREAILGPRTNSLPESKRP